MVRRKLEVETPQRKRRPVALQRHLEELIDLSIGLGANGRAADVLAAGWLAGERLGILERRDDFRMVYGTTVQSGSITRSIPQLERVRTRYMDTRDAKALSSLVVLGRELSKLSLSEQRRLGRYLFKPSSVLPEEGQRFETIISDLRRVLKLDSDVK